MPNPKRNRPPLDIETAATRYRQGLSLRALVELTGYCYGTVRQRLLDHGVVLRKPGGNRQPPARAA